MAKQQESSFISSKYKNVNVFLPNIDKSERIAWAFKFEYHIRDVQINRSQINWKLLPHFNTVSFCFPPKQKLPIIALKRKFSNFDSAPNTWWCEQKSLCDEGVMKFSADQGRLISKQRFEFLVFLKIVNFKMASLKYAKIAWLQLFMKTNRVNISNWNDKETNRAWLTLTFNWLLL